MIMVDNYSINNLYFPNKINQEAVMIFSKGDILFCQRYLSKHKINKRM